MRAICGFYAEVFSFYKESYSPKYAKATQSPIIFVHHGLSWYNPNRNRQTVKFIFHGLYYGQNQWPQYVKLTVLILTL